MVFPRAISLSLAMAACGPCVSAFSAAADTIQFNRDIRPILSENCLSCHGPDPGSRKAGLRLDTEEGFFAATDKRGPTIVAGKPEDSPFYQRIMSEDPDELMPPAESHKQLTPEQKELLKNWIAQGAKWQPHWAFLKPERPAVPELADSPAPVRNAIDAFVFAKLHEKGLAPEAEADRRTLARRLSLDLVGFVPPPEEVDAFAADGAPDFYEKYVRTLMDSPRYGEHRARYWLDAARYGDTHGLHFDNYREMWPYRDWVIAAFNKNQPFDQFVTEQIAGDLLPQPTMDQLVATGFQRCNITTNEGGTIEAENLANYGRDRVETTSWVFLGLTANCASCHDHKFDPITTRDFYAMEAFFRNTTQTGFDGNNKFGANATIVVPQTEEDRLRWAALPGEIDRQNQQLAARRQEAAAPFEQWLAAVKAEDIGEGAQPEALVAHAPLTEGAGDEIGALCGEPMKFKATGPVVWKPDGKLGPAPELKAGANFDLGNQGDFEGDKPFSYGAWIKTPGNNVFAGVVARMDEANSYRGWDLWLQGTEIGVHIIHKWPESAIKVVATGNVIKPGEWQHVFATYDGSGKAAGVRLYVNGQPAALRTDADSLKGTIRNEVPLRIGQRSRGAVFEGGSAQDVRLYARQVAPEEVRALHSTGPLRALLAVAPEQRSPEQKAAFFEHYLATKDTPFMDLQKTLAVLTEERDAIKGRSPVTHVQQEKKDSEPMANVLMRGNYDQLGEKVKADVFHALHPMPEGAPHNRLGLAQWINAPDNPLTSRVVINRLWQEIFGTGIVKTAEDFGLMGEAPVNQELLDWLAVEFRESGWDMKHMVRLMVTSSAYRQGVATTPEKREKDRDNRLLSRGPRFRMDAEVLRDSALAASGRLSPKIGGPSVRPYQPDGIWDKVGMAEGDTRIYKQDSGESLYRRSMYSFWKRMAPPVTLEIFNAPARELACLRRERTNTPLQALATLNDTQFIEAARLLAEKALQARPGDVDGTLEFIVQRLLSRSLRAEERGIVKGTFDDALSYYQADPGAAAAFLAVGETRSDAALDPPTLAAWTLIANQLMNLDEAVNK